MGKSKTEYAKNQHGINRAEQDRDKQGGYIAICRKPAFGHFWLHRICRYGSDWTKQEIFADTKNIEFVTVY